MTKNFYFGNWDNDAIAAFIKLQDAWDNPGVEEAMYELAFRAQLDADDEKYEDWYAVALELEKKLNVVLC